MRDGTSPPVWDRVRAAQGAPAWGSRVTVGACVRDVYAYTSAACVRLAHAMYTTMATGTTVKRAASTRVPVGQAPAPGTSPAHGSTPTCPSRSARLRRG